MGRKTNGANTGRPAKATHRRVNGYRRITLSNHEIAMPNVPLREDVEVHLIPDAIKNILDVRIGGKIEWFILSIL